MDVLKPKLEGGSGLLREEFELHVTDRMRVVAVYWIAPSSEPDRKHVNLRIEQYKKNPTDLRFPDEPVQKINLQDDDIANLISSAKAQSVLKDSGVSDRVIVMKGEAVGEILKLTNRDIASITQLVASLTDENIQALAKRVNPEIVEKIDSAVKYIRMEKSLSWLRAKIEEDVDEAVFQKWFEENTWIFGKDYVHRVPKRTVGLESRADLIYVSVDGFADLVELKKSVLAKSILLPDASHKTFYPSAAAHFELYVAEHQSSDLRSPARDGRQHPSAVRAGGGNPVLVIQLRTETGLHLNVQRLEPLLVSGYQRSYRENRPGRLSHPVAFGTN